MDWSRTAGNGVRALPLVEDQIDAASALLARAFVDDRLMTYMLPAADERARLLEWYFRTAVRYGMLFGEVSALTGASADGGLDGVAVWAPVGEPAVMIDRMERSGMLRAPEVLGADAFGRYVGVVSYLEGLRKRDMPAQYLYLWLVAVDPALRGRGLGAALLNPLVERADWDNLSCYLETFERANIAFYHRLGFGTLRHDVEPHSGLAFWTMRRDPLSR